MGIFSRYWGNIPKAKVHPKKESLSKEANFREQWPCLKNRIFLDRYQGGFINHARSDKTRY
jgi:hypothetical protein